MAKGKTVTDEICFQFSIEAYFLIVNNCSVKSGGRENKISTFDLYRTVVILKVRNINLSDEEKLIFRPLFFFTYANNAPMLTFGGYLNYLKNDFNLHLFKNFIRPKDDDYKIITPNITYKESELLNKKVPNSLKKYLNDKEIKFIPESEKKTIS